MQISHWCVLAIMLFPYLLVGMARLPGLTLEKNLIPRIVSESLTGYRQRMFWAHQNALEVIAPFAIAVFMADTLQANPQVINNYAIAFVGFRLAHAFMYIMNRGVLRTIMFIAAYICIILIFIEGAGQV